MILFGRILGKNNRLYAAYTQEWLVWAQQPVGTFPTFAEWKITGQSFHTLPWFDSYADACHICLHDGNLVYPIDAAYHAYRWGHAPVTTGKEPRS